jgi:hypothetical protein
LANNILSGFPFLFSDCCNNFIPFYNVGVYHNKCVIVERRATACHARLRMHNALIAEYALRIDRWLHEIMHSVEAALC